jgi:hypothetical protein
MATPTIMVNPTIMGGAATGAAAISTAPDTVTIVVVDASNHEKGAASAALFFACSMMGSAKAGAEASRRVITARLSTIHILAAQLFLIAP